MASLSMVRSILGNFTDVFAVFGTVAALYVTVKLFNSIWIGLKTFVLAKPLGLSTDLKKNGSWAVITGCTDGIGKAYAEQIAAQGLNCVLISRTKSKLEDLANEIESQYHVKTLIVVADFSAGFDIYPHIQQQLKDLEVGVLVNNVGLSYLYPEYFADVPNRDQSMKDLINVNIVSTTMMTCCVLPKMVERRRGVIINLSSIAGSNPTPLLAGYSASKAYVDIFTRSLEAEYGSRGIAFQTITPFYVATAMSKIKRPRWNVPSSTSFVKSALGTVGVNSRTCGFWAHDLMRFVTRSLLPESLLVGHIKSTLIAGNKKAKKRAAKSE